MIDGCTSMVRGLDGRGKYGSLIVVGLITTVGATLFEGE
jgi:CO dehydrogenase/acetyl-CoA synthase epsilon subunit